MRVRYNLIKQPLATKRRRRRPAATPSSLSIRLPLSPSPAPGTPSSLHPKSCRPPYYYARVFRDPNGRFVEEIDRYAQALLYRRVALDCFAAAQS